MLRSRRGSAANTAAPPPPSHHPDTAEANASSPPGAVTLDTAGGGGGAAGTPMGAYGGGGGGGAPFPPSPVATNYGSSVGVVPLLAGGGGGGDGGGRGARRMGFKDWKRRAGETALQRIGLANPSNDENSGALDAPLSDFARIREDLGNMQAQLTAYVAATEAEFQAARQLTFLHAQRSGEAARHVKAALCTSAVHDATIKGMQDQLCAPLRAALAYCDATDAASKRRAALILDYDHHKRKLAAAAQRVGAAGGGAPARRASATDAEERDLALRQAKFDASTAELRASTSDLLARITALTRVEPQLREALCAGLAAAAAFRARAALAPLTAGGLLADDGVTDLIAAMEALRPGGGGASGVSGGGERGGSPGLAAYGRQPSTPSFALGGGSGGSGGGSVGAPSATPTATPAAVAQQAQHPPQVAEQEVFVLELLAAAAAEARAEFDAATAAASAPPPPPGLLFGHALSTLVGDTEGGSAAAAPLSPPPALLEWVAYLDARALRERGLFRVPGAADAVAALRRAYDAGEPITLGTTGNTAHNSTGSAGPDAAPSAVPPHGPHDVAALLKLFFRELPEPLIPVCEYRAALEAAAAASAATAAIDGGGTGGAGSAGAPPPSPTAAPSPSPAASAAAADAFVRAAAPLFARLPRACAACARPLLALLHRVAAHSAHNKMTAENLGIVLAPTLLRSAADSPPAVVDLPLCITFVRWAVETAPQLFEGLWEGYPGGGGSGVSSAGSSAHSGGSARQAVAAVVPPPRPPSPSAPAPQP